MGETENPVNSGVSEPTEGEQEEGTEGEETPVIDEGNNSEEDQENDSTENQEQEEETSGEDHETAVMGEKVTPMANEDGTFTVHLPSDSATVTVTGDPTTTAGQDYTFTVTPQKGYGNPTVTAYTGTVKETGTEVAVEVGSPTKVDGDVYEYTCTITDATLSGMTTGVNEITIEASAIQFYAMNAEYSGEEVQFGFIGSIKEGDYINVDGRDLFTGNKDLVLDIKIKDGVSGKAIDKVRYAIGADSYPSDEEQGIEITAGSDGYYRIPAAEIVDVIKVLITTKEVATDEVTLTFKDYADRYTIESLTVDGQAVTDRTTVTDGVLKGEKGTTAYFVLTPVEDKFNIGRVLAGKTPVGKIKGLYEQATGQEIAPYMYDLSANAEINATLVLNDNANVANFEASDEPHFTIDAGQEDETLKTSLDDTDGAYIRRVRTSKGSVTVQVKPEDGYQIDGITDEYGVPVDEKNTETGAYTVPVNFYKSPMSYKVAVSGVELTEDGGTFTVAYEEETVLGKGTNWEGTSKDNLTFAIAPVSAGNVEQTDAGYVVKSGADYVIFTLTPTAKRKDKVIPVVTVGGKTWTGTKQADGAYRYSVSAGVFKSGTTTEIKVDQKAAKKNLLVAWDSLNGVNIQSASIVVDGKETPVEEYDFSWDESVTMDGNVYDSVRAIEVDVDSSAAVTVSGDIVSWQVGEDGEPKTLETPATEQKITVASVDKDTTIFINPKEKAKMHKLTVTATHPNVVNVTDEYGEEINGTAEFAEGSEYVVTFGLKETAVNYTIKSYKLDGGAEQEVANNAARVTVSFVGEENAKDHTLEIITAENEQQYKAQLTLKGATKALTPAADGTYAVDYNEQYTASVLLNNSAVDITSANFDGYNSQIANDGKSVEIGFYSGDAGQTKTLRLYTGSENARQQIAVLKLKVAETTYATTLKLKKGKGLSTLYTGQEAVIVDEVDFGKGVTCKEIESVEDEREKDRLEVEYVPVGNKVSIQARVPSNLEGDTFNKDILGKHTIVVTAVTGEDMVPAQAKITVTVVQGIESMTLDAGTDQIFKETGRAATLKTTLTYNGGDKADKPKTAKADYVIVKTDSDELLNNSEITVKNGTVTVGKNFSGTNVSFRVKATAADFTADTRTTAYTNPITIVTDETKKTVIEGVYIVDSSNKVIAASGTKQLHTVKKSTELNGGRVVAVSSETPYAEGDQIPDTAIVKKEGPQYLKYTASNKAVTISKTGVIHVEKAGVKGVKITVEAIDGSKAKSTLENLDVSYETDDLMLVVERSESYNGNEYRFVGSNFYNKAGGEVKKGTAGKITYEASSDSVLKLTVKKADGGELEGCHNFTIAVKNAKVLSKVTNQSGQVETIVIPNKKDVVVTLTDKRNNAKANANVDEEDKTGAKWECEIINTGFKDAKVDKDYFLKASNIQLKNKKAVLWAGSKNTQQMNYRATLPVKYESDLKTGKLYVMVKPDAADKSNAKKAALYRQLGFYDNADETAFVPIRYAGDVTKKVSGTDTLTAVLGDFDLDFAAGLAAGSYKLQMIIGYNSDDDENYNDIEPVSNAVAMNLKVTAKAKLSYKPFSTAKMSLKDTTEVRLAGTGKNFNFDSYDTLRNATFNGKSNAFTTYFEIEDIYDEWDYDVIGTVLKLKDDLTDEQLAFITGNSKEAKNARIGFVDYTVYGEEYYTTDGYYDNEILAEGTAKVTVTFTGASTDLNKVKPVGKYTAANVKVMQNTKTADIQVTVAKKPAALASQVLVESDTNTFKNASVRGNGVVSLTAEAKLPAGKHKVSLWVIPSDSYYAGKSLSKTDIKKYGVEVKTNVEVVKLDAAKKIAVDKKDTAQSFSVYPYDRHWYENGMYSIWVPYQKNVNGVEIDRIVAKQDDSAKTDAKAIDMEVYGQGISISLAKSGVNTAIKYAKAKEVKKSGVVTSYTVPINAEISFKNGVSTSETIKFTLTIPAEIVKGNDDKNWDKAVEKIADVKARVEKEMELEFWDDLTKDDLENHISEDGSKYEFSSDSGDLWYWFVRNALEEAKDRISEIVTDDYDAKVQMKQLDGKVNAWDDLDAPSIIINKADLTFPEFDVQGKLTIRACLGRTVGDYTSSDINITLTDTKCKPRDVESNINAFITALQTSNEYKYLRNNEVTPDKIAAAARAYLNKGSDKYKDLRVGADFSSTRLATTEADGEIGVIVNVWGPKYGGTELKKNVVITLPKETAAVSAQKAKLDDIINTYMKHSASADGLGGVNYDSSKNEFTVFVNDESKNAKDAFVAWANDKDQDDQLKVDAVRSLHNAFKDEWDSVTSITLSATVTSGLRSDSRSKTFEKQDGETIYQFADRLHDQMKDNQEGYISRLEDYIKRLNEDQPGLDVDLTYGCLKKYQVVGTLDVSVNYSDKAAATQSYKIKLK